MTDTHYRSYTPTERACIEVALNLLGVSGLTVDPAGNLQDGEGREVSWTDLNVGFERLSAADAVTRQAAKLMNVTLLADELYKVITAIPKRLSSELLNRLGEQVGLEKADRFERNVMKHHRGLPFAKAAEQARQRSYELGESPSNRNPR